MSTHQCRPRLVKRACEVALESPIFQDSDTDEEYDREFREFIESISMPAEELAANVGMAESSIAEAEEPLRYVKIATLQQNPPSLGRAVPGAGAGLVIHGGFAARNLG